jgi:hypothetical protein
LTTIGSFQLMYHGISSHPSCLVRDLSSGFTSSN